MSDTYTIHIRCSNCTFGRQAIEVKKGTTVADFLKKLRCTRCGCFTLIQDR